MKYARKQERGVHTGYGAVTSGHDLIKAKPPADQPAALALYGKSSILIGLAIETRPEVFAVVSHLQVNSPVDSLQLIGHGAYRIG